MTRTTGNVRWFCSVPVNLARRRTPLMLIESTHNCDKLYVEKITETLEQAVSKQFPDNETVEEEDTVLLMKVPDSEEVRKAKAT